MSRSRGLRKVEGIISEKNVFSFLNLDVVRSVGASGCVLLPYEHC